MNATQKRKPSKTSKAIKQIRYVFEALFLSFILLIAKILPLKTASNFGGWIGRTIGIRLAASRKAINNLKMIYPDKTQKEIEQITIGMWDNLGRVIFEYSHLEKIARHHTTIKNIEILDEYKNKPVIFISAHMANWEICPPAFLLQHNIKANPVYRPPNNPIVDHMLNKKRSIKGQLSPIPKSMTGTRQMVKNIKDGESIGLLIDQKYNEGVVAEFMGKPAKTADNFIALSRKFDIPIIHLHIERLKGTEFQITIHPPIKTNPSDDNATLNASHDIIKGWIDKHPEQWLWLHRRWMTQQEIERHHKNDA